MENISSKFVSNSHNEREEFFYSYEKDYRRESFKRGIESRKKQKGKDKILFNKGSKPFGNKKMQPHFGREVKQFFTPSLSRLASIGGIDLTDEILKEIEGLTALFVVLSGSQDYLTMSAGLFLYIREKFPKSMSNSVIAYIQDALESDFLAHEGQEENVDSGERNKNAWIQFIRDVKENWTLCKGNRLFGQFSKIFGLLVTFGLCNADNVTFDIKVYELIEPGLRIVHGDALS